MAERERCEAFVAVSQEWRRVADELRGYVEGLMTDTMPDGLPPGAATSWRRGIWI